MPRNYFEFQSIALILSGLFVPHNDLKLWALTVSASIGAEVIQYYSRKYLGV
jgi:hypothetical protein